MNRTCCVVCRVPDEVRGTRDTQGWMDLGCVGGPLVDPRSPIWTGALDVRVHRNHRTGTRRWGTVTGRRGRPWDGSNVEPEGHKAPPTPPCPVHLPATTGQSTVQCTMKPVILRDGWTSEVVGDPLWVPALQSEPAPQTSCRPRRIGTQAPVLLTRLPCALRSTGVGVGGVPPRAVDVHRCSGSHAPHSTR